MRKTLKLDKKASIEIRPKAPFNFDATVFKPSHFPTPDHIWEKGKYWQTMRIDSKIVGFELENKGTIKNPKINISFYVKNSFGKIFSGKENKAKKIPWLEKEIRL